ncbi:hypothetical protein [Salinigranum marinum]|uniref:hypothetical protein n=1 Tax=Salinigranum marinum TaxID=1515595 RepID=UPI00298A04C4|nr:hypothetical protein [Salinigranum marinum]
MVPPLPSPPPAAAFALGTAPHPSVSSTPLLASPTLLVRWLHVLAATVAVGGSVLTWALLRAGRLDLDVALFAARGYEWLFWAAVGTLVATGVGNVGAFAPTLPGGRWRTVLDLKLGLIAVVLVGSALRATLLARLRTRPHPTAGRLLRVSYGATAAGLVVLLSLAAVLAHG